MKLLIELESAFLGERAIVLISPITSSRNFLTSLLTAFLNYFSKISKFHFFLKIILKMLAAQSPHNTSVTCQSSENAKQ